MVELSHMEDRSIRLDKDTNYQHAHAHLRSRARGAGNKWEYVAESTVLTCSVSQGGVGKTLILTKLQGRSGREIIDNQQVTERG